MNEKEQRTGKKSLCKGELFQRRAAAWRTRLGDRIAGISQARFAKSMQERYRRLGSEMKCDQKNVSNWLHVGDEGKGGTFPSYEAMIQIAEELGVDVGYLTGETDGETFDAASASEYLGLSIDAIEALHGLVRGLGSTFGYKYGPDPSLVGILNAILTSPGLRSLLLEMRYFATERDRISRGTNAVNKVCSRYSKQLVDKAWFVLNDKRLPPINPFFYETVDEYWADNKEILSDAGITYTLLRGVLIVASQLDAAVDCLENDDFEKNKTEIAYRYQISTLFEDLMKEVFPPLEQD